MSCIHHQNHKTAFQRKIKQQHIQFIYNFQKNNKLIFNNLY